MSLYNSFKFTRYGEEINLLLKVRTTYNLILVDKGCLYLFRHLPILRVILLMSLELLFDGPLISIVYTIIEIIFKMQNLIKTGRFEIICMISINDRECTQREVNDLFVYTNSRSFLVHRKNINLTLCYHIAAITVHSILTRDPGGIFLLDLHCDFVIELIMFYMLNE